ncbi:MAG: hypothetical protein A2008_03425 [Candidatus Wallbacteria bacterium GWC2_49_35]|uniref:Lnb N-terminal periplasmic domain-containing protein n=1 Tax=Candidatus Wallbacteria bacterium GWC2_49_35 TaxID=1817813 RepID=A0A1F7WZ52_9BACT|nr:MAG: hypothetical protein A2008_03425 [Candidatus Wallbacteria bacterium GWC2_49_35]HBC76893.1 hypothetical protein [Candidatus Wallbacteria bacterium]
MSKHSIRKSLMILAALFFVLSSLTPAMAETFEWNTKQRPAQLINKTDAGAYQIGNVRWGFQKSEDYSNLQPFWRNAAIDVNKISDVLFIVKPFEPEWIAAHCLLIFKFSEPIISDQNEKADGLVLSIEARLLKGQKYSLMQGNFGKFFIVYQLGTDADYLQYSAIEKKRLIPYKLKLTHEQKVELLKNTIAESVKNRDGEKYNTINNSCTNNLFILLNTVLPKEQKFREWILKKVIYNVGISFPRTAGKLLKKHKVVEEELPIMTPGAPKTDIASLAGEFNTAMSKGPVANELGGDDLVIANKNAASIAVKADKIKAAFVEAINEGTITKDMIKSTMYDEDAEQLMGLFVPGVNPSEEEKTGFVVGAEFAEKLVAINDNATLAAYMGELFDSYKAAAAKRLTLEGPDVSKYLDSNLNALHKGLDKSVKYLKLNKR